jgi:hypothetical protein
MHMHTHSSLHMHMHMRTHNSLQLAPSWETGERPAQSSAENATMLV